MTAISEHGGRQLPAACPGYIKKPTKPALPISRTPSLRWMISGYTTTHRAEDRQGWFRKAGRARSAFWWTTRRTGLRGHSISLESLLRGACVRRCRATVKRLVLIEGRGRPVLAVLAVGRAAVARFPRRGGGLAVASGDSIGAGIRCCSALRLGLWVDGTRTPGENRTAVTPGNVQSRAFISRSSAIVAPP
jgi:hypothetical protein